jgi:hypothetical protein
MSMQDSRGFDGVSKKTNRVAPLKHAMMECSVAAELMETVTPERKR